MHHSQMGVFVTFFTLSEAYPVLTFLVGREMRSFENDMDPAGARQRAVDKQYSGCDEAPESS